MNRVRYIFIYEQYKNRLRVHSKFMIVITPKKKVIKEISTLSAMFYFFYLKKNHFSVQQEMKNPQGQKHHLFLMMCHYELN